MINNPPVAVFTPQQKRRKLEKHMKINTSRNAAFTLVEIMIVVAIIGMLAAIAIPNFVKARNTSQANACINNMRQRSEERRVGKEEKGKKDNDPIETSGADGAQTYIKGQKIHT